MKVQRPQMCPLMKVLVNIIHQCRMWQVCIEKQYIFTLKKINKGQTLMLFYHLSILSFIFSFVFAQEQTEGDGVMLASKLAPLEVLVTFGHY